MLPSDLQDLELHIDLANIPVEVQGRLWQLLMTDGVVEKVGLLACTGSIKHTTL